MLTVVLSNIAWIILVNSLSGFGYRSYPRITRSTVVDFCAGFIKIIRHYACYILARSGEVPLTVQLTLEGKDQSSLSGESVTHGGIHPMEVYDWEVPRMLIAQMHRMRSLSLRLWYWSRSGWRGLFTTPAPALRRFHLFNEDPVALPARLFDDAAGMLKSIYLDWVYLPTNQV